MSESKCPFNHQLRPGLAPPPERIRILPLDKRGFPIPFFIDYVDGEPEFRAADGRKLVRCVRENLCWVCGQKLGKFKAFVIGPMCALNRTSAEPPSHRDCAIWSAENCPFLTQQQKRRRTDDVFTEAAMVENAAGMMITRQPGVTLVWITTNYQIFDDGAGGKLFRIGDHAETLWFSHGRPSTRAEVEESIRTGLPILEEMAREEGEEALWELKRRLLAVQELLPAAGEEVRP